MSQKLNNQKLRRGSTTRSRRQAEQWTAQDGPVTSYKVNLRTGERIEPPPPPVAAPTFAQRLNAFMELHAPSSPTTEYQ